MSRCALAALGLLAILVVPSVARAQQLYRPWLDPDAVDVNQEREQHSAFWERTLDPNAHQFDDLLKRVALTLRNRDKQSRADAEALLHRAIALSPDDPRGYWYLGQVQYLSADYAACAVSLTRVAALDAEFQGQALAGLPDNIDYDTGLCLALAGNYPEALGHYRRVLAAGGSWSFLHWRMGEAYMALGRLEDAIASLKEARREHGHDAIILYALAAALDRDEQVAAARAVLDDALRNDNGQTRLARADVVIVPPEDVYYYYGLAYASVSPYQPPPRPGDRRDRRIDPARALLKMRRFVAEHGPGPWSRRAKAHIAELAAEPLSSGSLQIAGDAGLDYDKSAAAIQKANTALQSCVTATPGVFYRVRITQVVRHGRGRVDNPFASGREAPIPGVRTTHVVEIETPTDDVTRAIECLDRAAGGIKLPAATGPTGSSVEAEFPVVAQ